MATPAASKAALRMLTPDSLRDIIVALYVSHGGSKLFQTQFIVAGLLENKQTVNCEQVRGQVVGEISGPLLNSLSAVPFDHPV